MDSEQAMLSLICQAGLYAIYKIKQRKREQRKREWWIRPWIAKRNEKGAFNTLIREFKQDDQDSFMNFFRLNPNLFDELERMIAEKIKKQDTTFRDSISVGERLAITLRFLASGKLSYVLCNFRL